MGRVGRTNQKVPSEWPAIFADDWPPCHIQIIASREVSGRAMRRAESLSLKTWILFTNRMMTAVSSTLTISKGAMAKNLPHGILLMAGFSAGAAGLQHKTRGS